MKSSIKSSQLEKAIEKLQAELKEIEDRLADSDLYSEANKKILKQQLGLQTETKKSISDTEEQWFDIQQQVEQFSHEA